VSTNSQIVFHSIKWINIEKKGKKEIDFLRKSFNFLDSDIKECYKETIHPAIFMRDDYAFFEMLFPVYNRKTQLIENKEINFFIKDNILITAHNNDLIQLKDFFNLLKNDNNLKKKYFQDNPIILLCGIFDYLLNSYFPMLNHMNDDVVGLEKYIFAGQEKLNTKNILKLKWNIVNFKRTIESHKNIIKHLIINGEHLFSVKRLKIYYNDLINKIEDISKILENEKESIGALEQTNNSLISFQLNDIMKTLAIISVIIMPPAFIASLFGVNAKIPYIDKPISFFIIVGICLFLIIFFLIFFKRKKWL
jgi:magnesium transporter